ncbi:MAG: bifunctional phosphopantothenoylcysteine decarboxylase/phosphopantothenate--cysteine ligase CoaBC, partial [Xanthomonadaceae bacterium]|nr:bifunctional phosphopantothenoylcysteine decarboxylase/phosphopantothenate--cysteine ligase CoaBC [Xanthomonadaceae bacterium]
MKIVVGVAGSIAAYKTPDLVRRLKEQNCEVRVVMTDGARAFISPLTLQAVSGNPVVYDLLDPAHEAGMGHIELSRWADLIVIAPASANTISKLACGLANDLLGAICLAAPCPIVIAPGMNRLMWDNPAIQDNLALLRERGLDIMEPGSGSQACGEVGKGRMPEPLEIRDYLMDHYGKKAQARATLLAGKRVVITAGPTVEEIDPVRYISNYSSGKMGYALAESAKKAGAEVILISGPVALTPPAGVELISIKTAAELLAASFKSVDADGIFIAAAAVADYRVANPAAQKLKKTDDSDTMTLVLTKNPDILASVSSLPQNKRPFCIGFAAETNDVLQHGKEKRARKNLDMICINDVSGGKVFGQDSNEMIILDRSDRE